MLKLLLCGLFWEFLCQNTQNGWSLKSFTSPQALSEILLFHKTAHRLSEKLPGVKNQTFLIVVHLCVFLIFSNPLYHRPHTLFLSSPPLQIPSAGQLMEAVRVKMKERKVLTEELATLATPVSEKAWLPGLRLGKLSSSSFSPSLLLSLPGSYSVGAGLSQAEPGQQNQYLWEKRCRLTLGHWLNTAARLL